MQPTLSSAAGSVTGAEATIFETRPLLRLHGFPAVSGLSQPLRLRHGLALLACLHEAPHPLSRDAVAALLWPDAPAATGRARLRRLLHELHGALGGALVCAETELLRLAPGCHSDVGATRRGMRAIADGARPLAALLRPLLDPAAVTLLDGFTLPGSETFDDWLAAQRRAHRAAWTAAVEAGARRALDDGDAPLAEAAAAALLREEACSEAGHAARMAARALAGDAAGVENAWFDCVALLRDELGVRPSPRLDEAWRQAVQLARRPASRPSIGYAPTRHGQVAHAVWGRGDETIVVLWGLVSNVEVALDEPRARALLDALAQRHRVVLLDRRGSGLSERVGIKPDADTAIEDVLAVLDRIGSRRAWLFGSSAGGTLALEFALRQPQRCAGLLLFGTSATGRHAEDAPWGLRADQLERWVDRLSDPGCYAESLAAFAPSAADDPAVRDWYARLLRNAGTRLGVADMLRSYHALDTRSRLHRLRLPTLVMQRRGDRVVPLAAGRQLAAAVPGARLLELDGDDHFLWHGARDAVLDAVCGFVAEHAAGAAQPLAA